MLNRAIYLLTMIGAVVMPRYYGIKKSVSSFVGERIDKYWKEDCEREVYFSNELRPNPPNVSCCDLVVYNNSGISGLGYLELDDLLLKASNSLKTLGIFAIDIENARNSIGYKIVLEDPEELWNYNFVNVETDYLKILCRKGSASISKDRHLKKIVPYKIENYKNLTLNENTTLKLGFIVIRTGNEGADYIINMLGFLFQYMFLFNFFSFGLMLLVNTFIHKGY